MMDTKNRIKKTLSGGSKIWVLSLLFISLQMNSQTRSDTTVDSLTLDSNIRYGRLENGFTYYIKSLEEPQSKLYMNLYVKAGSNDSEKEEINISHAVEHLAFKASKNFPHGIEQSKEVDQLGMTIYDLKAFSSKRTTAYHFDSPANNPSAVNTGLTYFRDIANGLLLTDEDIEAVKGELRQEYLLKVKDPKKLEADTRLTSKIFPCSHDYTNFISQQAEMDPGVVRAFYRDYYRPDLLVISVIGNISDMNKMEERIKTTFSGLENPKPLKMLKNCDSLYYHKSPQFYVVERELNSSKVVRNRSVNLQIRYRDPKAFYNLSNSQGLQRIQMTDLLGQVLDRRFAEISSGNKSFNVFNENMYPNSILGGLLIEIEAKDNQAQTALQKIQKVLVQLQKFGVSREEFQKLKSNYLKLLNSLDQEDPRYWKDQIYFHFVVGEALPEQKQLMQKKYISSLTLDDFNDFIASYLSSEPQDIGIVVPSGSLTLNWEEDEVRSWIKDQQKSTVETFSYAKAPEGLLLPEQEKKLENNVGYKVKQKAEGIKEYHLDNGLRLVLQSIEPTSKSGKIVINGYSKKGICTVPEEKLYSALYAPEVVLASGVNNLSKLQVEQYIRDKGLFPGVLSFYVGNNESGIQAFGKVNQLETILKLLYLYITHPSKNKAAFEDWKETKFASASNLVINEFNQAIKERTADPTIIENVFGRKILSGSSKMIGGIEKIDLDESQEYFNHFFGNAKDFTLVVSGDFEIDSVSPILIKYLGNLPTGNSRIFNCAQEKRVSLPKGPKNYLVPPPPKTELLNVKYALKFIKNAAKYDGWREQLKVEVLGKLTNIRAWNLRFKDGFAIYDVLLRGEVNKKINRYEIYSYLDLAPKEYPIVRAEIQKIFKEMKTELVSDEDLEKAVQYVVSKVYRLDGAPGTIQKRNEILFDNYRFDEEIVEPEEMKKFLNSITPQDMRDFAKQIYQDKYYYEFVMKDNEI